MPLHWVMGAIAHDFAILAIAVALAALGGEAFLKGVLGTARWLRAPKLLVATTVAAFATSGPELTVSTMAALAGRPEIALGDALGSNVVNIALIFGLALLFGPIGIKRRELGRDFGLALVVPLLTWWFVADGVLSRLEGGVLLFSFIGWMTLNVRAGVMKRKAADADAVSISFGKTAAYGLGGLFALVLAGRLFVTGATSIAATLGVDAYLIGAIMIAIGTSLPELVTVLLARLRGYDEVAVGTLLGSNLFNGLAIVGLAASIHPAHVPLAEAAVALLAGIGALLLLIPGHAEFVTRRRGVILLSVYVAFVLATLAAGRD